MENNLNQETNIVAEGFTTTDAMLIHWQGHRRLTRKVIEAFPEDKLFTYSIGGMRPFSAMINELVSIATIGLQDLFKDDPTSLNDLQYHRDKLPLATKEEILDSWDKVTVIINALWPQIPQESFYEVIKAFGEYEGVTSDIILYWIDNEIHHRAQGYVYLRALGIQPPAFWDRY
ncbi:Uncharacterized damage-inducible protein DinB (forms a four-helix bundle) [Mucilaginibacter mallensis]|uniref:Uncharacterized damage-inducible protein DinB (Forms a four-helix bundle) n=1 Tax=Mucilaginibacter mallensis TaxID=652787 RepID=A0A1H1W7N7_MUCMA|nr:DinB family protein [Mucilaginibacter mallensis]SDS93064.1 Uncharacterized damage-inducible protein DinB (forms a four-helix bundle) [Mucilaginibacter mallensis]